MPWPEEPCETCPRSRLGLPMPCMAMSTGHARFCELANPNHKDYNKNYVNLITETKPEIKQPTKNYIPKQTYVSPKIADNLAIVGAVNLCKFRSRRKSDFIDGQHVVIHVYTNEDGTEERTSDCGCGLHRCRLGKGDRGDGFVNDIDCRKCVIESGIVAPSSSGNLPGFGDPIRVS